MALLEQLEKQAAQTQRRAFDVDAGSAESEQAAMAVQAAVRGKQGRKAAAARHQDKAEQQQVAGVGPLSSHRFRLELPCFAMLSPDLRARHDTDHKPLKVV